MNIMAETPTIAAAPADAANILHAVEHIALSRLVPSKANVRRMNTLVGVSELADSIEAHGLIHNLTVRKAKKGKCEVVAGARRLAALSLLAKEGRLGVDTEIPCNVLDADDDAEISLAENVQREAMHIVDEILAYRDLAERGTPPENIAARFGQSVITVRQRLKLAHLSPKILDVMREDKMSLEQARALAISDSHDEQERAWFNTVQWNRDPHSLRSLLTSEHVRSTNRLAVFVGMDAYEAAGGLVLRDLFADNAATFLTDPALLNQLATAALEQVAEPVKAEGWKWVEPSLDANALHRGGFGRIYAKAREFTDDEQARLSAFDARLEELAAQMEDMDEGDELTASENERDTIELEMEAIQEGVKAFDPQEMAWAGCIVTVDQSGTVQVNRGYVAAEDMAGLAQLRRGLAETDADAEGEDGDGGEAPALPDHEAQPELTYSAPLVEELTAIRTAALRVEVAGNVHIALAALLHPLVSAEIYTCSASYSTSHAVEVRGQSRNLVPSLKEPSAVRALADWNAVREMWGDHLPGNPADLWGWLMAQSVERLLDLLAFVTAANLNAVKAKHEHSRERLANAEKVASAVNLDMTTYWKPDAAFFSRLSKAGIAEVLTEAGCKPQAVRAIEKAPKSEAVDEAEKLLSGTGWLPTMMQTALADTGEDA